MNDTKKAEYVEQVAARFESLNLSPAEVRSLLNYVTSYAPEAVDAACDQAERSRARRCTHAGDCSGHVAGDAGCDCRDPGCTGQCCGEGVCPCTPAGSTTYPPRESLFDRLQGEWVPR